MFVYTITHKTNGKQYVGLDTAPLTELHRVRCHFAAARVLKRGGVLKTRSKIANAIAKYGDDSFIINIEKTFDDFEACKDFEIELIACRDTVKNGYNILPGGQGMPRDDDVKDPEVLAVLREARSRGSKTANRNRWAKQNARAEMGAWLHTPEVAAKKADSLSHYWQMLSPEDRAARSIARAAGNPWLYVSGEDSDTNLRSLLRRLPKGSVSHRTIEQIVRLEGKYEGHIVIEKRAN
jgi:hypothetical protein